jgi:hypothetical protein
LECKIYHNVLLNTKSQIEFYRFLQLQLATNVDDILIWNKDPMDVIKSLEKTYMSKSVDIPEYSLGGNVEFLGE